MKVILEDYSQWKKGSVLHISSQSDMQSKQTRCALIAARLHGGEHAAVGYTTVLEVSLLKGKRKGLSAFTGKFP